MYTGNGISADELVEDELSFVSPIPMEDGGRLEEIGQIILISLFSLLFIVSTILNTLFLIIFARKSSLRNISNRFIVSLTISNILTACFLLPIVVADLYLKEKLFTIPLTSLVEEQGSFLPGGSPLEGSLLPAESTSISVSWTASIPAYLCVTFGALTDFVVCSSIFATLLIAIDRFFAITDPFHYHTIITRWRSSCMMVGGWFLAWCVAAISGWVNSGTGGTWNVCKLSQVEQQSKNWLQISFGGFSFMLCFLLPLVALCWTYAKIYEAAQQNSERARRSSLGSQTLEVMDHHAKNNVSRSPSTRSTSSQICSTIRRRISNASLFLYREEARAAKISVGVVVLFIICWMPYYLTKIIQDSVDQTIIPALLDKIVLLFAFFNSTISPYVYMYRSKRIQKEVLKLFGVERKPKKNLDRKRAVYSKLPPSMEVIQSDTPPATTIDISTQCIEKSLTSDKKHISYLIDRLLLPDRTLDRNYCNIGRSNSWRNSLAVSPPGFSASNSSAMSNSTLSCSSQLLFEGGIVQGVKGTKSLPQIRLNDEL